MIFFLGCETTVGVDKSGGAGGHDSADGDTADSAEPNPEPACDELAPLPVTPGYLSGFQGSEDFAFDAEGYLVGLDPNGSLLGINQAMETKLILPRASDYGAGMRFLPGGDLVFADVVTGSLVRVVPATGASTIVLGGLEYPNGLDVDGDGMVYVSEQNAGRVRRVDPDTGAYEVVAKDLYNPNGVTFSPGYDSLYVGSFGAGVVWVVDRDGEGWAAPRVYATTPEAPGLPPDWCDNYGVGADCPAYYGYGLGTCVEDETGDTTCTIVYDSAACEGLAEGDACEGERLGVSIDSTCQSSADGLFCPSTSAEWIEACEGARTGAACEVHGVRGSCNESYEGVLACYDWQAHYDAMEAGCVDKALGDECSIDHELYASVGLCSDGSIYGLGGIVCVGGGYAYSEYGGLDGINVDACDNVYVTEYIQGIVWRFDDEGAEARKVAKLRSQWIPNMHWGNGVGGWDLSTFYVMDRQRQGVFTLELGVEGHGDAYRP
jgi:sugar lactone lactonase YvrE